MIVVIMIISIIIVVTISNTNNSSKNIIIVVVIIVVMIGHGLAGGGVDLLDVLGWHCYIISHYPVAEVQQGKGPGSEVEAAACGQPREPLKDLGWHYLSNATCLRQPHLFSTALLV